MPRRGVDFVPPSQPDESPPGDVFQVVEIRCEEENGEDKYEDTGSWPGLVSI